MKRLRSQRGATELEYALLLSLIPVLMLPALNFSGLMADTQFRSVGCAMDPSAIECAQHSGSGGSTQDQRTPHDTPDQPHPNMGGGTKEINSGDDSPPDYSNQDPSAIGG